MEVAFNQQVIPVVALVHNSRLFAEGLAKILQETPFKLVLQAAPFETASLEKLRAQSRLIVLVGAQTASKIAETVRNVRCQLGSAYILVIGAASGTQEVMLALAAGADGYLRETVTSQALTKAIELAAHGQTVLPAAFVKNLANINRAREPEISVPEISALQERSIGDSGLAENDSAPFMSPLSEREVSILEGLVEGAPNKVIAQKLSITEATVKVHVKAILRKTRTKNRTQAALWAIKYQTSERASIARGLNGHA